MSEENTNGNDAVESNQIVYSEEEAEGLKIIKTSAPKAGKACQHAIKMPEGVKNWLKTFNEKTVEGWIVKSFKVDFQKACRVAMETGQDDLLASFSELVAKGQVPSVSSFDPMTAMKNKMASMSKEEAAAALKELQAFLSA